jgi:hypothetical protein
MQAVIDAWVEVYRDELTNEQIAACAWTSQSIDRMVVENSITNDTYNASGTLFSGWRLTTFINTALNYIYLKKAGINETVMSVHNGDDVYAGLDNLAQAVKIIKSAHKLNIRANLSKMSIGTIAEFLRMDMRAQSPTACQYLTRACATYVHGRIETESPLSCRSLIRAYYERFRQLKQRGGTGRTSRNVFRKQRFFCSRLFNTDVEILKKYVAWPQWNGGYQKDGDMHSQEIVDVGTELRPELIEECERRVKNGANAYVKYLQRHFPSLLTDIRVKNMTSSIVKMFNVVKTRMVLQECDINEKYSERALTGAWSTDPGINKVHKLRMGVTDVICVVGVISPGKAAMLQSIKDPLKWLNILIA